MNTFEITGTLHKKFDTESKTATFQTREFVILVADDRFPQYIKFQLAQDRVGIIDAYQEGNEIKVHFDLRGREWQGKYFTNLNAWRVEAGSNQTAASSSADQEPGPSPFDLDNADDDLPF
jgi:hypothetical protein